MGLLLNYLDGRMVIFDNILFDDRENENDNKNVILEIDLEYLPVLHLRDDDYLQAPEIMIIELKITGEKQHKLRVQYFSLACPYSRKLICSFMSKKNYVKYSQLLHFYLNRELRLVKLHRAIRFKLSPYVASYIANNTS